MLHRTHRLFGVLSLALILSVTLSGCGIIIINDPYETRSESGESDAMSSGISSGSYEHTSVEKYEEPDYDAVVDSFFADLPQLSYNGATFIITSVSTSTLLGEDEYTYLSESASKRNKRVEDYYDVKLLIDENSIDTIRSEIASSIKLEEHYTDLLMLPASYIGIFAANDLLTNLRSLPLIDTDKPYFNHTSIVASSGGYSTYAIAGSASFSPSSVTAVYFNRDMFIENGLELPYSSVYSGDWTWDKMLEYMTVAASIDGVTNECVSVSSHEYLERLIYSSSGASLVSSGALVTPSVSLDTALGNETMRVLGALYNDHALYTGDNAAGIFHSGAAMFMIDHLYVMDWIYDSADAWGLLPLPKLDASTPYYYTRVDSTAPMFAVPLGPVDLTRSAAVLAAFNAASYGVFVEDYVNYRLRNTLRDDMSVEILNMLCGNPLYDFSFVFGDAYSFIYNGTTGIFRSALNGADTFSNLCAYNVPTVNYYLSLYFPVE